MEISSDRNRICTRDVRDLVLVAPLPHLFLAYRW